MQRLGRRPEWAAMTDEQILAFHRARYPHIALGTAKELHRCELKFWHLGALKEKAKREARPRHQHRRGRVDDQGAVDCGRPRWA